MQRKNSRLGSALTGYVILMLVPIALMVLQGVQSLQQKRDDLYVNAVTELNTQDEHLRYTMEREWNLFIDREQSRPFDDYFPVTRLKNENYRTLQPTEAFQRSPLYSTLKSAAGSSRHTQENTHLFQPAVMGYFEFNPYKMKISTPYDPYGLFHDTHANQKSFSEFLDTTISPRIIEILKLDNFNEKDPLALLLKLKTHLTHKTRQPVQHLGDVFNLDDFADQSMLEVNYYSFNFYTIENDNASLLVAIRAVLIGSEIIRLQGFVINLLNVLQEIQAYQEPLQSDYGQVVVGLSVEGGRSFFAPFNQLSSSVVIHKDHSALESLKSEERRFWKMMIALVIILFVSSVALSRFITAEIRLNQKKTDFISAITHELKTPLTSIKMYAEMLEEGWAKGKETTYYRHINSESQRLTRLIGNVLNFARLEKGSFQLQSSPMELCSFLKETFASWQIWLQEFGLQINLDIQSEAWIVADSDAMKQVLYNLCDNAIKYAKNPDGTILSVKLNLDNGFACLFIHDNGPGVPQEETKNIFERFYRIESEWTRESTGTGLGLALVKEIILKSNGTLEPFIPEDSKGFGLKMAFPLIEGGLPFD
ncbi:MAG: hypothetical protein CSA81_05495 [Acidobacteria bacterium]|nr:MAG: hypothetical protein CSA81_05495 [Acidobacteriota bacterium]PIE90957.1 MAG: hypothetical protein CR997_03615 [Acidobacteriota bacterium]